MGAIYTHGASKADIIKEQCATEMLYDGATDQNVVSTWSKSFCTRVRTITKCVRGNILWSIAVKETRPNTESNEWTEVYRTIVCTVLTKAPEGWGSYNLPESSGPYYHDCPLAYLDLVPVQSEAWRKRVIQHHAEHDRPKFTTGDVIVFDLPLDFRNGLSIQRFQCVNRKSNLFVGFINGVKLNTQFKISAANLRARKFSVETATVAQTV